ncbi:MAG: HYR domain-containing protein, partial [Bacteroidales bacterium]|nr:HYR domain-containing protein [Bacteroidales bacterium]
MSGKSHLSTRDTCYLSGIIEAPRVIMTLAFILMACSVAFTQADGDYITRATGNWNDNNTWQVRVSGTWNDCLAGDYPGAATGAGTVWLTGGFTVSVSASVSNPVAAITYIGEAQSNSIEFGGNYSLNVTGQITINPPTGGTNDNTLIVNSGTLAAGSLTSSNSNNNARRCLVSVSTGNLIINGDFLMGNNAARSQFTLTDAGTLSVHGNLVTGTLTGAGNSTINVTGDFFPSAFTHGNSTVNFNGTDQTIRSYTYGNVTASNSGVKTLANASFTITGNLTVDNSTLAYTASTNRNLTVSGNLAGNGTIDMSQGDRQHGLYLGGENNSIGSLVTNLSASTVYYNRAGDQIVFTSPSYRNLTLLNGGDKTLEGDISVSGTLNLSNGRIVLGDHDLTLSGTSAVAGITASRYVVTDGSGQLKKAFAAGSAGAYTLPVGDILNYSPVSLTFTSNTLPRIVGVNVTNAQHPNDGTTDNYISRYWSFTNDQPGDYTYSATFTYVLADLTGTHSNLRVNRWEGSTWTQYNTTGGSPTLTVSGVDQTTAPLDNSDFTGRINSATTYIWDQPGTSADWTDPQSWSPARLSPQPTDILVFDNVGSVTATDVITQTIGQLDIINGSVVSLESNLNNQLITISGVGGSGLDIAAGNTLILNSSSGNRTTIAFSPATVNAVIAGQLIINQNTALSNTFDATNSNTVVSGVITNNGGVINSSSANLSFEDGASYVHARNGGTIPAATWVANATTNVIGLTAAIPAGLNQTFGHLNMNCPGLVSALTPTLSGDVTVQGNFTISGTTAANYLRLNTTNRNFTVNGTTLIGNHGIIFDNNNTGLNRFDGLMTLEPDGIFQIASNSSCEFRGGITNNGTFTKTGSGSTSFTTNPNQIIQGSNPYNISNGNLVIVDPASIEVSSDINFGGTNLVVDSDQPEALKAVAGLFTFSLNGNQFLNGSGTGSVTFHNLTAGVGGTKTLNLPADINGNLLIENNRILNLGTTTKTINIAGNMTVDGTLDFWTTAPKSVNLAGNLIDVTGTITMGGGVAHVINLSGEQNFINAFNATAGGGSMVNYNRAGSQEVFGTNNYVNLGISGGGIKQLQNNASVSGNIILTNGVLHLGSSDLTITNNNTNAVQGVLSATNMIETDGTGAVIRNAAATLPISFPVGSGGYYSPMEIISTSATTGQIRVIAVPATDLSHNFISRYWDVVTTTPGKTITATFHYDPDEIDSPPTDIWYRIVAGDWQTPTGTGSFGANSFTITGTTTMTSSSTHWTAGAKRIYYSYQNGDWNTPTTWTTDPSGTLQIGNTVPGINDDVVILSGRTVYLSDNISTQGLGITIEAGAFLNMEDFSFNNQLSYLHGRGTLQLASPDFPDVALNTFVDAGNGTTEYMTQYDFDLPSYQTVYNNLIINTSGFTAIQLFNLTLNGNLTVRTGIFKINDDISSIPLNLTIQGSVIVGESGEIAVGTGVTNPDISSVTSGGVAPFINYYTYFHTVRIYGDFVNEGFVRFTNLDNPVYNEFPPTLAGANSGAASVFFLGDSDNILTCNGITDFYNLIVSKGVDQTRTLTISSSDHNNFRLFGANSMVAENTGSDPNIRKALWLRTGTVILEGSLAIPSLTEGITAGTPGSDYIIPANAALILDGADVAVLTTADDYREANALCGTTIPDNSAAGISGGGANALVIYGRLGIRNGYLSTRESGGLITSSVSSGQIVIEGGVVDTKQLLGSTGTAQFTQSGGILILRGRLRRTPVSFATFDDITDISDGTLNLNRLASGINTAFGTFNLENTGNIFTMSGGIIRICDVTGTDPGEEKAFDVKSAPANIGVTGGSLEILPFAGADMPDATSFKVHTTAPLGELTVNRSGSISVAVLNTPLVVLGDFNLISGDLDANNFDISIGGNLLFNAGTTYTTGTNTTLVNGSLNQTITNNLVSPLDLNNLAIIKPSGRMVTLHGTQAVLNVSGSFSMQLATLDDNGRTINVAGNIFNSGIHTGTGSFVVNGTTPQSIAGEGTFENVLLNNTHASTAPVTLSAAMTVTGTLTFGQDNLFNIGAYNLTLTASASFVNAGPARYVHTSGNAGDGGLTRVYDSAADFTFHVGAPTITPAQPVKYAPATIGFSSAPAAYGSVTVIPVGYEHPNTSVKNQNLTWFWRVRSAGFSGIAPGSVTHTFVYDENDVVGNEANYVPSLFTTTDFTWKSGTNSNPPVDITTNTITDWFAPGNSTDFLDADYTAGETSFSPPQIYYSRQTGLWTDLTTWSLTGHDVDDLPLAAPGASDIVIIGGADSVYLATLLTIPNLGADSCATLQIEQGSALDVGFNPGSVFSMVMSHPNGNGNFRLTTTQNSGATFQFPSGDFSDFNVNRGTTELYTTNPAAGTTYYLPETVSEYGNLILSPLGGSNVMFANRDVTIYGNLITRGQDADSWFCPTWGTTYPGAIPAVPKTITVLGNIDIQGGSLIWYQNGAIAQDFVVYGDVQVGTASALYVWSGGSNQSLSIGGSLINNTDGLSTGTSTTRQVNLSNIPTTFFGEDDAFITNTAGTPRMEFGQLIVNKGTSQAATLTLDIESTLITPVNNWLNLQNGTFRYMRIDPATNFTISTTTPFNIPATAGLHIDYQNGYNVNVLIANANSNTNDLFLDGKLTVSNGNVYVGPVTFPGSNNDIEYSGGGSSEIEINGGTLTVNGQIRRSSTSTNGVLKFTQTGGDVIINGMAHLNTRAKLEIVNTGSEFTMSGGTITIPRGGGTTFGDLYLRPSTYSVTGGTIRFAHTVTADQNYGLEASVPLNNLFISGRTAATARNATVNLLISPLVLQGNLELENNRSILNSNDLDITIRGDLINNGTYNYGTNTTTFIGTVQNITGTTVQNFNNLVVTPATSLTVSGNFSVDGNLDIANGNLVLGDYLVTLFGNLTNIGSYTDNNTTGGISLSGPSLQLITGTGAYGRLELNNPSGARINNNISLTNDLLLTQGILDIGQYRLTLSVNSSIGGAPFSSAKMIRSDGVLSSSGLRKLFSAGPQLFTFPVGVGAKYTPGVLNLASNAAVGFVNINPVNNTHPSVIDQDNALAYYWQIESSGLTGVDGDFMLQYIPADVMGIESDYVAARLVLPGSNWQKAIPGPATDNVDEAAHQASFYYSATNNLNGDYTAGDFNAIPGDVPTYRTNTSGNWSDETVWTPVGASPPCPPGGPYGANVIIEHTVTTDINNVFALNSTITGTLRVVSPTFGHSLGNVDGDGTIYLESGNLPAGDFNAFLNCAGNATLEYGGSGSYTIIATQYNSVPNLFFTGTGTRILPNKDLTICHRLVIDGPVLDNSINNARLIILGTMERYSSGAFNSGSGAAPLATVSFAGSVMQTIGGPAGDFIGVNGFNNLEINNSAGLEIGLNGAVEVKNQLLLTEGVIHTTSSNTLTLLNTSSSTVVPEGGVATSFVSGPLTKRILNGGSFLYPIGQGSLKGHKFTLTSTAGSTLPWTVEYFSPNGTASSLAAPLQVTNTMEYWSVSTTTNTTARVKIGWDPTSDLTPLMTVNGMSDMRVAEDNAGLWTELLSVTSGNNNTGDVATVNNVNISTVPGIFTTASISTTKARASLASPGPVCGSAGIPVNFSSFTPILLDFTLDYTINGVIRPTITVSSLPYVLPTPMPGEYKLTGFTYNNGANTGVVDGIGVMVYSEPIVAVAGPDQSLCGVSGTVLQGNNPGGLNRLWGVLLGTGGTFVNNTQHNTVFTGVLGETYVLRWTISNGPCESYDDVVIAFPVAAAMPGPFLSAPTQVCQGSGGYVYSVPAEVGVTYNWSYTGTGHTINGTGNSVTIDFSPAATSGTLSVTATNACGTSAPRSVNITVNPRPAPSIVGANLVCPNAAGVVYATTDNPGNTYSWVVGGGLIIGPTTASSIVVNWGPGPAGTVRVTETQTVSGCTYTTPDYAVTIADNVLPVIAGCPSNIVVNNDPGLCSAVVTWIEPTATDNCSAPGTIVWLRSHIPGSVFPVGTTLVTYTATDQAGNTSAPCTFNVTVIDNTPPVITLPAPPVLNANASCQATVPVIAATATDNCTASGSITITQAPLAGTIIGEGVTVVTVTATDLAGNSSVGSINVTVVDIDPPVFIPPINPTVNLDNNCQALIPDFLAALVVTDNCTPPALISRSQVPTAGSIISGVGPTDVKIYAEDIAGNLDSITVVVNAADVTQPVVICRDVVLYLNGTGNATLTAADVNNGSSDNCTVALTYVLSRTSFNCSDTGAPANVTLTAFDESGNSASCASQVTVIDTISPIVNVKTYTLVLDATGTGTLLPGDVDNGSFDNCGPITLSVAPNFFSCGDQGPQTVTLTAVDASGNSSSADVIITVASSLNINSISLNNCELAAPFALYTADVTGGDENYSYFWQGLEPGSEPFIEITGVFPFLVFSNTSASETPFFNNLMPDGVYNIRLIVTDGNGCTDTSVLVVNKTGLVFNNVSVRYSDACDGQISSYIVNYDTDATYNWGVENGTILTTDLDTNRIDVEWNTGFPQGVVIATILKPNILGFPCESSVVDTVTIHPTPTPAFNTPATTVCTGDMVTYTLTDTYLNYAWTITGGAINGGGTVGSNFADVIWGPGPDGRVSVSVQNAFSCAGSVYVDVLINTNTITLTSANDNQTVCVGTPIADITYATTGATGATVTGLPLGVTGSWASDVVTISGTPTGSGSFTYTVTLLGGCGTVTTTGAINVTPDNTISLTSANDNQTVCIGTPISNNTNATTCATGATFTGLPLGV